MKEDKTRDYVKLTAGITKTNKEIAVMKHKTIMKAITVLLVLTLAVTAVWAGGKKPGAVAEKKVVSGAPQYGGTFTAFVRDSMNTDPPGPDMADAHRGSFQWLDLLLQKPVVGDMEKYGPAGTNQYSFQLLGAIPDKYQKGLLLESWEISFEKLVWHVRPGIHWAPTKHQSAWMEPRELTAEDIALDIKVFVASAYKRRFEGLLIPDGVTVIDKYTLEIKFDQRYSADLFYFLGYEDRSVISAPEMAAVPGRAAKWENQVGTGAFMFEEYVIGSHMSMVKNPNYWDTTVIDGKEYKMPFIDRVVLPIIPDPATRMAALKTGTIDLGVDVPAEQWSILDKSTPDLEKANITGGAGIRLALRNDVPPFDDVKVRRAMMIGTDLEKHQYVWLASGMPIHYYPIIPGHPSYTPMEELPADIKILYDYNPELAKKMLADAGYPDGFKMDFHTDSNNPKAMDLASLVEDQWSKIGVDVTIVPSDQVEHTRKKYSHPPIWTGAFWDYIMEASATRMYTMYHKSGVDLNYMAYSNSELDALCELMERELDSTEQDRQIKEAGFVLMRDVPAIPVSIVPQRIYWWPWLQNYYGSSTIQDDANFAEQVPYFWIDQDLKAKMGH